MSALRDAVNRGSQFIVTCEFVPGRGSDGPAIDEALEFGRKAMNSGLPIHAVSITDSPGGSPALNPDVLAAELKNIGLESLVHVSCSGLNRIAFESRVSALSHSGLNNVLVISGDYPDGGWDSQAKPVFDLDSVQAIKLLKDMNAGIPVLGKNNKSLTALPETDFFVAGSVSPFKHSEAELVMQFAKMEKKIHAGADVVISQIGYDIRRFAEILKYLQVRNLKTPVLGNCYVLSRAAARAMNKGNIPGCIVPDELLKRIEAEYESADKGRSARMERAAQLTALFRSLKFAGVHIGGFGLKFEDFEFIIRRSEELAPQWREFASDFQFTRQTEFCMFPDDPELRFDEKSLVPVKLSYRPKFSFHYLLSKLVHRFVFTENTVGFNVGKMVYGMLEKWRVGAKIAYFNERVAKEVLYDCRECGDCALFDSNYVCPMAKCVKNQRNGPCGGSCNGACEADNLKKCYWVQVYERDNSPKRIEAFREKYNPPVNWALSRTSSWANFFLGKDHTTRDAKS